MKYFKLMLSKMNYKILLIKRNYYLHLRDFPRFRFFMDFPQLILIISISILTFLSIIVLHNTNYLYVTTYIIAFGVYSYLPICLFMFVYRKIKERLNCIKMYNILHGANKKIVFRTNRQIKNELQDEIDNILYAAKDYTHRMNTTLDENEFHYCYDNAIKEMRKLQQYEELNIYVDCTPTENINDFIKDYDKFYDSFLGRTVNETITDSEYDYINRTYAESDCQQNEDYELLEIKKEKYTYDFITRYATECNNYLKKKDYEEMNMNKFNTDNYNKSELDCYFADTARLVIEKNKASIAMIQKVFKISFNRSVNLIDQLEQAGVVSREFGTKPRKVLMSMNEFEYFLDHQYEANSRNYNNIDTDISKKDYDSMDGHDFEYYCADVLSKNGFSNVSVTQGSGDHGIDILAEKDDITYAIQCKCYDKNINNSAIQQAHTGKSLYHKDIGVVMTNQYFTPHAIEEATQLGVKLWDRNKLDELINNIS